MATAHPGHAKRMTTWCVLVFVLIGLFLVAGYMLFESPGAGPAVQKQSQVPVSADR